MTKKKIIEKWDKKAKEYDAFVNDKSKPLVDRLIAAKQSNELLMCILDLHKLNG